MNTLREDLARVLATLPHEEALDRLVDAWRREPDAVLAEAAVRLDRLTSRSALSGPIAARSVRWRALVEDGSPRALGEAIAAFPFGTIEESLEQLEALAARPDPRFGERVARLLVDPPLRSPKARPFWRRAFAAVAEAGDGRAAALLRGRRALVEREFAAPMNVWVAADLDASIPPTLAKRGVVPEEDPLLLALAPTLAASVAAHDAAAWFERVYASPFDDDLRRVLADRLLAAGDERGELINLQLSPEPKAKSATRREKELTDRFGRRWLGALDPVILKTGVGFARGFLDSCHLKAKSKPALQKVIGAAEWSTVRSITEESMSWTLSPLVTKLFLHPVMRSLRVLGGPCSVELFRALCLGREERPIESLVHGQLAMSPSMTWSSGSGWTVLPPEGPTYDPADVEALTSCPGLPNLRALDLCGAYHRVPPRYLRWLLDGELAQRLVRLTLRPGEEFLGEWLLALKDHPLPVLECAGDERASHYVAERDAAGRLSRLTVHLRVSSYPQVWRGDAPMSPFQDFLTMLARLTPGALTRLHVVLPKKDLRGAKAQPTAAQREALERRLEALAIPEVQIEGLA
jgi:hypothetical protein